MTLANALAFIKRGQKETVLRNTLNKTSSLSEMSAVLINENLKFSAHEIEEAFSLSLFKSQEYEEAQGIKAFKMWWDLLCMSQGERESNGRIQ